MCTVGSTNDNRITRAVNGLRMTTFNTYNKMYMTKGLIKCHFYMYKDSTLKITILIITQGPLGG